MPDLTIPPLQLMQKCEACGQDFECPVPAAFCEGCDHERRQEARYDV